jgi:signal transduction histidine kinase
MTAEDILPKPEHLRRKVKELEALYEVSTAILSELTLDRVLQLIVERALTVLGADVVVLFQYFQDHHQFVTPPAIAGQLLDRSWSYDYEIKEDDVQVQIVRHGESYYAPSAETDQLMAGGMSLHLGKRRRFVEREKVKSSAGILLKVRDEVMGVLFANYRRPHQFADDERNSIELFASQAAIAILNARLYEDLEWKVEERTRELQTAHSRLTKAMKDLKETQEQMLASERWAVLGKAAANLAHRINNTAGLIPVVTQDLQELLADVALEEERRQEIDADLQRIERNTRFTLQMAGALFKPFEDLPTEECDVNALLEESISVANVPEDVALITKYADGLPRVFASRLLADVFVELMTNAVKAMPDGGELEIGSRPGKEGWVEAWFSDTGHGIPPESQGKIFDLFFTTSEDSLGFGLWCVKTFLLQQGATVDVESEVGKGTTFTVRLPVEGPQAAVE